MALTGLLLIWRDHFVARIVRPIDNITNMHFSRFNYFCVLMLITTLLALQTEASAQDSASAPQPTGASADSGEAARESATEQVSEEHVSDAERHKRLKETIELDQAKLAQTRKELDTQQVIFDRINALNEKLEKGIAKKKKQLEAIGGAAILSVAFAFGAQNRCTIMSPTS
jgi:hypothetical protein